MRGAEDGTTRPEGRTAARSAGPEPARPGRARLLRGLGNVFGAVAGLLLLGTAGGALLFTQTQAGRDLAASFVEDALGNAVNGRVEVGPITGGNLLSRAVVSHFSIRGPGGRRFLTLDDVRVEYNPLGFLAGRFHFRRVSVGGMQLSLRQDEEGRWEHERIFEAEGSAGGEEDTRRRRESRPEGERQAGGEGNRVLLTDVTVRSGRLEVRTPWRPTEEGGEDVIWRVAPGDGEAPPERLVLLDSLRGRLPAVRLVDPEEPLELRVRGLAGRLGAVTQPLRLEGLSGAAAFGDTASVRIEDLRVGGSRLRGEGEILPPEAGRASAFRFRLEADPLRFEELRWLPLPLPARGGGRGRIVLRSDGTRLAVAVEEGVFRSGDSRVSGSFDLLLEEPARFGSFDLTLRPLRLRTVHELLGDPERPDGWVEGRLSGSGRLSLLALDGALALRESGERRPGDGAPADPASRIRVEGAVGLVEPHLIRDLRLELAGFDPRWIGLLGRPPPQEGRLSGSVRLDGRTGSRIAFRADLSHSAPGDTTSHVSGEGTVDVPAAHVDVRLDGRPLSLSLLNPYFPNFRLVGAVRGPLSATGTFSDLEASAELETPRGRIRFDGRFDLTSPRKRYDATLLASDVNLRQWTDEAPTTRLAVRGRVSGSGTEPADLEARFDLDLLPSVVAGARIDTSILRVTVEEGLARADSFHVRSEIGSVRGHGVFGFSPDRTGPLVLDMEVPDLARLDRWIAEAWGPGRTEAAPEDLFAVFPAWPEGEEDVPETPPAERRDTLSGRVSARGVIAGNVSDFQVGGRLRGADLRYGDLAADSVELTLDVPAPASPDTLVMRGTAWGARRGELGTDSVFARLERRGPARNVVTLHAARGDSVRLEVRGEAAWTAERRALRLEAFGLRVGGQRFVLPDEARLVYGRSGLSVEGLALSDPSGGLVRVDGAIPAEGGAEFEVQIRSLELENVARLISLERDVGGLVGARLRVEGTAAAPLMEARVSVDRPRLDGIDVPGISAQLGYGERSVTGGATIAGARTPILRVEGSVAADLSFRRVEDRLPEEPLDLRFVADSLPLSLLELRWPGLREVRGSARGELRVGGAPGSLRLGGEGRVREGAFGLPALGVRLTELDGRFRFEGARALIDSLGFASAAGGRGTISGSVGLEDPGSPSLDLAVTLRGLRGIDRRRASLLLNGRGELGGDVGRPSLGGRFRLSDGTIRIEEFLRRERIVDLTDPQLVALLDTASVEELRVVERARNPFLQNLKADLELTIGPDLWIRSQDLEVETRGELSLEMDRAQGEVHVFGPLTLVRGNYRYEPVPGYQRQLRISEGRVEFVGTPGVNPNLDITAVHRTRGPEGPITVRVDIGGTMLAPTLALSSEPPMGETDQICVLLFNTPRATGCGPLAGRMERGEVVGLAQEQLLGRIGSQISSLLGGTGGPEYVDVRSVGYRGAGEADGEGGAEIADQPFVGTEVELGWYLSPEIFVTVTQPLGGRLPGFSVLWSFADYWSAEVRSDERFPLPAGVSAGSNIDTQRLWGLFLFREWSF